MNKLSSESETFPGVTGLKKDQLAFDLIILFSFIFYWILTRATGHDVSQLFSPAATYVLCIFFLFLLSMNCGYLHLLYSKQKMFFGYVIIFVAVLLMSFPFVISNPVGGYTTAGIIATFTTATGFAIGRSVMTGNIPKTIERFVLLMLLVPISVGLIIWMIQFSGDDGYIGVFICIFGFLGVALLGFLIAWLFKKNNASLHAWCNTKRFRRSIKLLTVLFAGLTAFAVSTWEESMYGAGITSGVDRIFRLTVTGILPFRLLWAFAPPRNNITVIIAVVVFLINIVFVFFG
ncbi:MAG TPA: hypothetical protein PKN48_02085 [Bacteroidales bacterium]|nr:hypothetical protein [Bacteroidales bacterium]